MPSEENRGKGFFFPFLFIYAEQMRQVCAHAWAHSWTNMAALSPTETSTCPPVKIWPNQFGLVGSSNNAAFERLPHSQRSSLACTFPNCTHTLPPYRKKKKKITEVIATHSSSPPLFWCPQMSRLTGSIDVYLFWNESMRVFSSKLITWLLKMKNHTKMWPLRELHGRHFGYQGSYFHPANKHRCED